MQVAVLIPVYNERATIVDIVSRVLAAGDFHVVVLDDSSPDGTARVAEQTFAGRDDVEVIVRPRKEGLGAAYAAGFRELLPRKFTLIATLDADGSHAPEELPLLLRASETSDLVVGSRYVAGADLPGLRVHRRALSMGMNACWRRMARGRLQDLTSAMRCYRPTALASLLERAVYSRHYGFLPELALAFLRGGWRVTEVPITYHARGGGSSKTSLRVCVAALGTLARAWVSTAKG